MEAIFVFGSVVVGVLTWPETYAPVLLDRRANVMRRTKGDDRYWHPHENIGFSFQAVATKHLLRPIKMLFTEPIVAVFYAICILCFRFVFCLPSGSPVGLC